MPTEQSESFTDNWAYLKIELRWLDQVLMLAVARQRKENHEIDRVTHARVDRATSSWWKGIISTEGKAVYDEHRQPSSGAKVTYQQQLESKIQASYRQGVRLGLPQLCDRLGLTLFEKNLVLMSLAPEINRRYARLYRYLQGEEPVQTDLPTLDLVLRLMCRNDLEWRDARHRLMTASPLVRHQLLHFSPQPHDSLLNCSLKLTLPLVNYLLAGQPTQADLETLLHVPALLPAPSASSMPSVLQQTSIAVNWSDLVLSAPLLSSLQALSQRIQGQGRAVTQWGLSSDRIGGTIALLAGANGTGKTTAAAAFAHSLDTSLHCLDLALVDPQDYAQVLQEIQTRAPGVLLLKSADRWFGRSALLPAHKQHQFWAERQKSGVTLLSVCQPSAVQCQWRQRVDQHLMFPKPNPDERRQLWHKAFPPQVPLAEIDWEALSRLPLTGGEIMTIAQDIICCAAATAAVEVAMQHVVQGLAQRGQKLQRSTVSAELLSQAEVEAPRTAPRSRQVKRTAAAPPKNPRKTTAKGQSKDRQQAS